MRFMCLLFSWVLFFFSACNIFVVLATCIASLRTRGISRLSMTCYRVAYFPFQPPRCLLFANYHFASSLPLFLVSSLSLSRLFINFISSCFFVILIIFSKLYVFIPLSFESLCFPCSVLLFSFRFPFPYCLFTLGSVDAVASSMSRLRDISQSSRCFHFYSVSLGRSICFCDEYLRLTLFLSWFSPSDWLLIISF